MQTGKSKVSRKKFVGWLGILSLFSLAGAAFRPWKDKKPKMVKMLTRDGKLVEVDARLLPPTRKKISDKELRSWVEKSS
jgi:hypothetical protein